MDIVKVGASAQPARRNRRSWEMMSKLPRSLQGRVSDLPLLEHVVLIVLQGEVVLEVAISMVVMSSIGVLVA
jgi:hypothetical protein